MWRKAAYVISNLKAGSFLLAFFVSISSCGQKPVAAFYPFELKPDQWKFIKKTYAYNKTIPDDYAPQILTALLYFPELKKVTITFRIRHRKAPLMTRPKWTSVLRPKNKRAFIVTISDTTTTKLCPILYRNLSYNAQIGVIGHELSHVADLDSKTVLGLLLNGINEASSEYIDRFEFKTDSICIAHGLGYQLLSWSSFIREALHIIYWEGPDHLQDDEGKRERYMNPTTINERIRKDLQYTE